MGRIDPVAAAVAIMALVSCTKASRTETPELMYVDRSFYPVSAESGEFFVSVHSNAEWTLNSDADWLKTSRTSAEATSGKLECIDMLVQYEANPGVGTREGRLVISTASLEQTIQIVQSPTQPRLTTTSPLSYKDISADGDGFRIDLFTNSRWSAGIRKGATAAVSIPVSEGEGSQTLVVKIGANATTSTKVAVVEVSVEGCERLVFTFTQKGKAK